MKLLWWKFRDYPTKRDKYGRSLREQAFDFYDEGYRPAQVFKGNLVAASMKTLLRYFEAWKKRNGKMSAANIRKLMKKNPEFGEDVINVLAEHYGVPPEQVVLKMQEPWGLMQLMKGEFPNRRLERTRSEIRDRLAAALRLINFGDRFYGNSPEMVNRLITEVVELENNTRLVIEKTDGQVSVRKAKMRNRSPARKSGQSMP